MKKALSSLACLSLLLLLSGCGCMCKKSKKAKKPMKKAKMVKPAAAPMVYDEMVEEVY